MPNSLMERDSALLPKNWVSVLLLSAREKALYVVVDSTESPVAYVEQTFSVLQADKYAACLMSSCEPLGNSDAATQKDILSKLRPLAFGDWREFEDQHSALQFVVEESKSEACTEAKNVYNGHDAGAIPQRQN